MPDVDLLVRWEVDPGLRGEEPVDLALRAKLGGEGAGEHVQLGKRIWGLAGDFGGIHRAINNNNNQLPPYYNQININGIR